MSSFSTPELSPWRTSLLGSRPMVLIDVFMIQVLQKLISSKGSSLFHFDCESSHALNTAISDRSFEIAGFRLRHPQLGEKKGEDVGIFRDAFGEGGAHAVA